MKRVREEHVKKRMCLAGKKPPIFNAVNATVTVAPYYSPSYQSNDESSMLRILQVRRPSRRVGSYNLVGLRRSIPTTFTLFFVVIEIPRR